ncbi:LysR family transcriptional regulator [Rhodobacterales bacterium 52_120_T64]|nr:LysR family transcriptional regulator [Rhodobacterales bacterium 52_120_T64]
MSEHNDTPENWTEIRTAYHVARLGTLSAAAEYIGIHHATVIRHIDALESQLESKLFHRHPRGYVPTEAGRDLMQIASATEDQFTQLARRLKGRNASVGGDLIVTTLSELSPYITPLLVEFQRQYPEVRISLVAEERRLKLEYGEAHVALRAGPKPQEPDNVVQPLCQLSVALFAHKDYVKKYGMLVAEADASNHRFVMSQTANSAAPFHAWIKQHVPVEAVTFRSNQVRSLIDAINSGAGIGYLTKKSGGANPDLIQMTAGRPEWESTLWIVTHIDLHRTAKVQALVKFLKENF